jgi:hypothetical protein
MKILQYPTIGDENKIENISVRVVFSKNPQRKLDLYLEACEDGEWESFMDITVNLHDSFYMANGEITNSYDVQRPTIPVFGYIRDDKSLLKFIQDNKLGTVVSTAQVRQQWGVISYPLVSFDFNQLLDVARNKTDLKVAYGPKTPVPEMER